MKLLVTDRAYSGLDKFRARVREVIGGHHLVLRQDGSNADLFTVSKMLGDAAPLAKAFQDVIHDPSFETSPTALFVVSVPDEVAAPLAWVLNEIAPKDPISPYDAHPRLAWVADIDPTPLNPDAKFALTGLLYQEYVKSSAMAAECSINQDLADKFLAQAAGYKQFGLEVMKR